MRDEMRRNFLGFVLLIAGVGLVLLSTHIASARLSDAGFSFIGMAALALQVTPPRPKKDQGEPEGAS